MSSPSFCRFCQNACPVHVEVEDGRAVRVTGDRDNPVYFGYTCVKGRALPEDHNHPDRLLHSQRRLADGTHEQVPVTRAIDEIGQRLTDIIRRFGPNSVAIYTGTKSAIPSPTGAVLCQPFLDAIGSRMRFTSDAIDQPGKHVAKGLHGQWMAPPQGFDNPDVGLIVGANPFVSYAGGLPLGHPGKTLQRWTKRGFKLIVIDPRRTDIAKRALIHLQPRPGEDASILAGMLRIILTEQLHDHDFVQENVQGIEKLRAVVQPFTPAYVAGRADIDEDALEQAARMFAAGQRGYAVASTGPNMSGPGTLVEYLILNLNTVCGRWLRAGERVAAPPTVVQLGVAKAQAIAPYPAYALGESLPSTGLSRSLGGLPTAALPDEILHGEVRALISCGGNPVAAWPDQLKTIEAMGALELLVQVDVRMSATAKLADFVVAPKMCLEVPGFTAVQDLAKLYGAAYTGYDAPWAQYTDAVVDPPPGSELIEEWDFFYKLAQRMGLQLEVGPTYAFAPGARHRMDMVNPPSTNDLLEFIAADARVPLSEVRAHPAGALFPDPPVYVEPKDPDCVARLDVANHQMMSDLAALATEPTATHFLPTGEPLDMRLISRRLQQTFNSSGRDLPGMSRRRYNPAFIHPDELTRLGLRPGDLAEIRSVRASIPAIVEADDTLRPGIVSMTHAFGDVPELDGEVREIGSSVSRLLSCEDLQPYTGQPRMSNVPITLRAMPNDVPHSDAPIGRQAVSRRSG